MYVFGIDIPILELIVIFSVVVVVYLIILEIEFRQLRKITRKFDEEEIALGKEMRELKEEISGLKDAISSLKPGAIKKAA
jgi:predicted Holliday junction resolvase-like endonuclease